MSNQNSSRIIQRLLLVPLLLFVCGASKFNWSWMVPGGEVQLDSNALSTQKFCALTFDDGPDHKYTPEIGRILARNGVPGTFFVLGNGIAENHDVLTELVTSGHQIECHSFSHPDFTRLSRSSAIDELKKTNDELAMLGISSKWFRPPYGAYNRSAVSSAAELGMKTILWSVDPRDWSTPGVEVIVNRVLKGAHPGAVILLHSTNPQTVAALPWIIEGLQDEGYQLVTISEWEQLVSGGSLPDPPMQVPLGPEPAGMPVDIPNHDYAGYGSSGLKVFSNFNGANALQRTLRHGRSSGTYSFSYEAAKLALPIDQSVQSAADVFSAAVDMVSRFSGPSGISEARGELPAGSGLPADPVTHVLWDALLQGSWNFPDELSSSQITGDGYAVATPEYFLIKAVGGSWSGSEAINRLLVGGRFTGIAVAREFSQNAQMDNVVSPAALVSVGRLPQQQVVNLSQQDVSGILRAVAANHTQLYITMNPADLAAYRGDGNISHIQHIPEFLLLRLATAGLETGNVGPELSAIIPDHIAFAVFGHGDEQVLALRGVPVLTAVHLPDNFTGGYLTRLSTAGSFETSALASKVIDVGDELLILSRIPLAGQ